MTVKLCKCKTLYMYVHIFIYILLCIGIWTFSISSKCMNCQNWNFYILSLLSVLITSTKFCIDWTQMLLGTLSQIKFFNLIFTFDPSTVS